MWFGESMAKALFEAMQRSFSLSRDEIFDTNKLLEIAGGAFGQLAVSTVLDSHHFVRGCCDWRCGCRWCQLLEVSHNA